jgi:hypothetical protein
MTILRDRDWIEASREGTERNEFEFENRFTLKNMERFLQRG